MVLTFGGATKQIAIRNGQPLLIFPRNFEKFHLETIRIGSMGMEVQSAWVNLKGMQEVKIKIKQTETLSWLLSLSKYI